MGAGTRGRVQPVGEVETSGRVWSRRDRGEMGWEWARVRSGGMGMGWGWARVGARVVGRDGKGMGASGHACGRGRAGASEVRSGEAGWEWARVRQRRAVVCG